jgi:hypothetical protein
MFIEPKENNNSKLRRSGMFSRVRNMSPPTELQNRFRLSILQIFRAYSAIAALIAWFWCVSRI